MKFTGVNGRRLDWRALIALVLVPLLVAGAFLAATWNFNANLHKVQAAIVNHDEMVTVDGQQVPMGRQLSAELVNSDKEQNFTWVLADAQHASDGLASGRYAAVVTIPKNFSASVTSFGGAASDAEQATITIETSPVAGIAETALGQSVAEAAARALNTTVTKTYLDRVYLGFNDNKKAMTSVADGARQLADGSTALTQGLDQAASGGKQLADGGPKLADGAAQLALGLGQAASGSKQLADNGPALADGAAQLSDGLGQMATKTKDLPGGAQQLADGAQKLSDGLGQLSAAGGQLNSGARQLADGAGQLSAGVGKLGDGADQLATGADGLASGAGQLSSGVDQYTDGVAQYVDGINSVIAPVQKIVAALPDLTQAMATVDGIMATLPERSKTANQQIEQAQTAVNALLKDAKQWDAAGAQVIDGLSNAQKVVDGVASGETTVACPEELKATEGACEAFAAGVQAGAKDASQALKQVDTADLTAAQKAIQANRTQITDTLDQAAMASQWVADNAGSIQSQWNQVRKQIPAGTSPNKAVMDGLTKLKNGGDQLKAGGTQLDTGAAKLADGAGQLADGAGQLASGVGQLETGAGQLATGADTFADKLPQYTGGVSQAATGASALSGGAGQLAGGLTQLVDGVNQLATGSAKLSDGVQQYTDGTAKLADGIAAASTGAGQLSGGVQQYTDGTAKLATGISDAAAGSKKVSDGQTKLADGLEQGLKQIPTYSDAERENLASVVAAPISTTGLDALVTPEAAAASLLLVVALWLGALATYTVVAPVDPRTAASSLPTGKLLGRALLPGLGVAGVQAVLLGGLGSAFLRLAPLPTIGLMGALLAAGVAFVLVNHALAAWAGVWGRIVSGALLLVTIVTALTYSGPAIFDGLRGITPASPALDATRAVMTGHSPALAIVTLVGWALVAGLAGWWKVQRERTVSVRSLAVADAAATA